MVVLTERVGRTKGFVWKQQTLVLEGQAKGWVSDHYDIGIDLPFPHIGGYLRYQLLRARLLDHQVHSRQGRLHARLPLWR